MPWYALYTKPRWEKKLSKCLTEKQIENYCPMQMVVKQWADRKKKVEIPLIPSYIFINIESTEIKKVKIIDGVLNFVYWLGEIAVIKDKEIIQLKKFNEKYKEGILIESIKREKDDIITITSGPFKDKKARVISVKKNSIELLLEGLGVRLFVEK
jgi:transcription antitermination factor NusG